MRIGYACMNRTLGTRTRACRLARCTPERVVELARENLRAVEVMARWNAEYGIGMLRITSNLVPFGSHAASGDWRSALEEDLSRAGNVLRETDQRVSTHPGQFVVLGTMKEDALARSVAELAYQADVLDLMDVEAEMVIHLGGAYGDKEAAIARWVERALNLPDRIRRRLVVENDDVVFNAGEALDAGQGAGFPVVFDVLHDAILPTPGLSRVEALARCLDTWRVRPGRTPKIHYSDQAENGPRGMHATRVDPDVFAAFLDETAGLSFDVMVEAKGKEEAVLPLLPLVGARNRGMRTSVVAP